MRKTLKTHKKYNSQPTMHFPFAGDNECNNLYKLESNKYSIQEARKKVGQMELIKTTQE